METLALILTLTAYSVTDGDTLRAGEVRIRLWGIDAPEPGEPGGHAAAAALEALTGGRVLRCEALDRDRWGRVVARCRLPDGRDLACEMVRAGHARDWPRYSGGAYAGCR
jgi:endonuclease YncB( thermonuclease family)